MVLGKGVRAVARELHDPATGAPRTLTGEFNWKVGGQQGEGIDSTGEIVSQTLNRLGYYVYQYRHFMSLIKGGHTNYKVRAADHLIRHHGDELHVLIAFDQKTIDHNLHELVRDGVVVYDDTFKARVPEGRPVRVYGVPLTKIARELGNPIMKNMVAVGVTAALVGLPVEEFRPTIEARFGGKGDQVVELNMEALRRGFEYGVREIGQVATLPRRPQVQRRLFISGNEAIAFGALAAGCRFLAAYPITPATEIMYWFLKNFPKYGGVVVQAEDEIAAVNMAIGANYAGVRAMTSTSGPGISLMQEAVGLAGMSETPLVVVDVMRGGPSTGLPTKTEQSDLNELIFGTHGEIPRIVLTPATVEDCFYLAVEAFNLAERYQCPVYLVSDLSLGMSRQSIDGLDYSRVRIDRGALITQEELDAMERGAYKRYLVTESGISPRSLPGMRNGRYVALGNEHDEAGTEEIEDTATREIQMKKRMRKLDSLDLSDYVDYYGDEPAERVDLLLVGWGSTIGRIQEAVARLEKDGYKVGHLHLRALYPFPRAKVRGYLQAAPRVLVVENNYTGQLAGYLAREVGFHDKIQNCTKYDGDPFLASEIYSRAREVLLHG